MKNKTDKDLLRLAARAAGICEGAFIQNGGGFDPLGDSEQAFDLMVELGLTVRCSGSMVTVEGEGLVSVTVDCCDDRYAATRRAIVMAAAEIAEGM